MTRLFKVDIQNFTDVITNSSSELFVIDTKNSSQNIKNILDMGCPNWQLEYTKPVLIYELDEMLLSKYISYYIWDRMGNGPTKFPYSLWLIEKGIFNKSYVEVISREITGRDRPYIYEPGLTNEGDSAVREYLKINMPNSYVIISLRDHPTEESVNLLGNISSEQYFIG